MRSGGKVRGIYQVNLMTSYGGFFEVFMGDGGTMVNAAEIKAEGSHVYEQTADKMAWEDYKERNGNAVTAVTTPRPARQPGKRAVKMDAETMKIAANMDKPPTSRI